MFPCLSSEQGYYTPESDHGSCMQKCGQHSTPFCMFPCLSSEHGYYTPESDHGQHLFVCSPAYHQSRGIIHLRVTMAAGYKSVVNTQHLFVCSPGYHQSMGIIHLRVTMVNTFLYVPLPIIRAGVLYTWEWPWQLDIKVWSTPFCMFPCLSPPESDHGSWIQTWEVGLECYSFFLFYPLGLKKTMLDCSQMFEPVSRFHTFTHACAHTEICGELTFCASRPWAWLKLILFWCCYTVWREHFQCLKLLTICLLLRHGLRACKHQEKSSKNLPPGGRLWGKVQYFFFWHWQAVIKKA